MASLSPVRSSIVFAAWLAGPVALAAQPAGAAPATSAANGASIWLYIAVGLVAAGLVLLAVTLAAILNRRRMGLTIPPTIEHEPRRERLSLGTPSTNPAPTAPMPTPKSRPAPAPQPAPDDTPAETYATGGQVAEAQRLFDLMGDAEDLAARISAQSNDQAERLQRLIRTADERIERLEELMSAPMPQAAPPPPMPAPQAYAPVAPPQPRPVANPPVVTRPVRSAPAPAHAPAAPVQRPASPWTPGAAAAPVARQPSHWQQPPAAPAPAPSDGGLDPLTAEIYRMADEGLDVVDIAKALGQHTGKVELILALRQG